MKKGSFEIALSGISAALAIICIVLSFYIPVMTLSFYALSGIMLMLPLVIDSIRGALLTFFASSLLGFLFTNIIAILPFVFVFGSGVIVMYLCAKYLAKKWFFIIPIKIVFINIGIFGIYSLMGLEQITGVFEWIGISPKYIWIALIATPVYLLYDYLLKGIFKYVKTRMRKIFKKRIVTEKEKSPKDREDSDNDPFN